MNQTIIFCGGVVVGGVIGYFIGKKREESFREAEIASIKEAYGHDNKKKNVASTENMERSVASVERPSDGMKKMKLSYIPDDDKSGDDEWDEADKQNPVEPEMVPYVISPDAFANEKPEYAKITLVYYEDNEVLINDQEECIDIGTDIGYDAINHFGEYEKDAVYIRNEQLGNDYEVLLEHASWEGGE